MGASFWWTRHPWRGDLGATLDEARQAAFAALPAEERAAAETPTKDLLRRLDLDAADRRRWKRWLDRASPATRYAVSCGENGTGSVLDVDHVEVLPPPPPRLAVPPGMALRVRPAPGLVGIRLATTEERADCFGTPSPSAWGEEHADWWAGRLDRGTAVAVVLTGGDAVLCGVTGD